MRRQLWLCGTFGLLLLIAAVVPAVADLVFTVEADNDAYVVDSDPNTVYNVSQLHAGRSGFTERSYVGFDTSSFAGVVGAYLRVYYIGFRGTVDQPVGVYQAASNSWSEATLTWNNQPGTTGTALDTWAFTGSTGPGWVEFDVTPAFAYDSNLSFVLMATSEAADGRSAFFASSEFTTPGYGPELEVHVPEPGTLALLGLGLAGILARRRRDV